MEPPPPSKKQIQLNSARGQTTNYNDGQPQTSARLNPQLTQRKSRGGRDPQKNHQSVEPPNIHLQANSINTIGTPGVNW